MARSTGKAAERGRTAKAAKAEQQKAERQKTQTEKLKLESLEDPIVLDIGPDDTVDLRDEATIPSKSGPMDDPAALDGAFDAVTTEDLKAEVGTAGGDSSLPDVGEISYDSIDLESDKDLFTDDMLSSDAPIGGLDGRNDAADYGGTGARTPMGDADALAGIRAEAMAATGDTAAEVGAELTAIVNDPNLSESEKQERIDGVLEDVETANEERISDKVSNLVDDDIASDGEAAAPAETATPTDTAATEGGSESGGALDYLSQKLYGRDFMGDAPKTGGGGLIGGASEGATDGVDTNVGKAAQSKVEAEAKEQIKKNDGVNKDVGYEEGLEAPTIAGLDDFVDEYQQQQTAGDLGADVDYGDQVDAAPAEFTGVDKNSYAGQYDEDYSEPTQAQVDQAAAHAIDEAGPEEEFFET
jgi:hypothetical protein